MILDNLADGIGQEDILRNYPTLKPEDIQATLSYGDRIGERPQSF